jgi:hypothetical protein
MGKESIIKVSLENQLAVGSWQLTVREHYCHSLSQLPTANCQLPTISKALLVPTQLRKVIN